MSRGEKVSAYVSMGRATCCLPWAAALGGCPSLPCFARSRPVCVVFRHDNGGTKRIMLTFPWAVPETKGPGTCANTSHMNGILQNQHALSNTGLDCPECRVLWYLCIYTVVKPKTRSHQFFQASCLQRQTVLCMQHSSSVSFHGCAVSWCGIHASPTPWCGGVGCVVEHYPTLDSGWSPTTWIHSCLAHSTFFAEKWRNIFQFSSIPTEYRHGPDKRRLKNCPKGWSLVRPSMSLRHMHHCMSMNALEQGLLGLDAAKASDIDEFV